MDGTIDDLLHTPLFREVTEETLLLFLHDTPNKLQHYRAGETVSRQGKPCRSLYLLCKGTVRTQMANAEGKLLTVGNIAAPELLAPAFVYATENRFPVNIDAVTPCDVWAIDKECFLRFMQQQPGVLRHFLTTLSDRGLFLSRKVNEFALQSLKERVVNYLQKHGEINNQQEVAHILGVARPSLARTLSELLTSGIIKKGTHGIELIHS